jgi:hypothetical protein
MRHSSNIRLTLDLKLIIKDPHSSNGDEVKNAILEVLAKDLRLWNSTPSSLFFDFHGVQTLSREVRNTIVTLINDLEDKYGMVTLLNPPVELQSFGSVLIDNDVMFDGFGDVLSFDDYKIAV